MNSFSFLVFFLFSTSSFAQIKSKLEEKRHAIASEILITSSFIDESTGYNKQANLDKYYVLKKQIKLRESLVKTVKKEIEITEKSIERTNEVIQSLTNDIQILEDEFGKMMKLALRQKLTYSKWLFFLSADSFNDAFKRWNYIRQFTNYRKKQTALIVETQNMLTSKSDLLGHQKNAKLKLIQEQQLNLSILKNESRDINKLLKSLKKNNKNLKENYKKKKTKRKKHKRVVEAIIQNEVQEATSTSAPKPYLSLTGSFGKNKGRLPWPVKSGIITKWFGRQAHPTLRKIEIENSGIDFRTRKKADIYAVFDGEIKRVFELPAGGGQSVMIKHGEYFTVYSNLDVVFVKKGQKIKAGTILGKAIVDIDSNKSELHFEVWRKKTTLNPADWIKNTN